MLLKGKFRFVHFIYIVTVTSNANYSGSISGFLTEPLNFAYSIFSNNLSPEHNCFVVRFAAAVRTTSNWAWNQSDLPVVPKYTVTLLYPDINNSAECGELSGHPLSQAVRSVAGQALHC